MNILSLRVYQQADRTPEPDVRPKLAVPSLDLSRRILSQFLQLLALLGLSVALYLLCVHLYTRDNTFPLGYHPDESSKAGQLLTNTRNYNHPQLMLEATLWTINREATPPDAQQITVAGRTTSARLAAAGVVLTAWAGFFAVGWSGFLLVGVATGLCPSLLVHAHYFKEDASLIFGLGMVLFAGAIIARVRRPVPLLAGSLLLGIACGVAASGKYAGAVLLVPALLLVIAATVRRWWVMPFCLILLGWGAVGSWRVINYRAFDDWPGFLDGFDRESAHGLEGHSAVSLPAMNTFFVDLTWAEATPHIKLLALAAPVALLLMRRRRPLTAVALPGEQTAPQRLALATPPVNGFADAVRRHWRSTLRNPVPARQPTVLFGWWVIGCWILYAVALGNSAIPFYRYALPLAVLLCTIAGLGAAWLCEIVSIRRVPHAAVVAVALGVIGLGSGLRCADNLYQFAHDSRDELRQWADVNLPPGSRVACDSYCGLGWNAYAPYRPRFRVRPAFFVPDLGTLEDLRRRRYDYLIVASTAYDRFILPGTIAAPGQERQFLHRYAFYRQLFDTCPVVKQWTAEHPMYAFTNPDIYVFRLQPTQNAR